MKHSKARAGIPLPSQAIALVADGVDCKRHEIEARQQRREVLLPVPEVVLQVIAPVLEHIEALVFDLPPGPSAGRKLGHSLADNREIGDKAVAVGDLAL